MSKLYINASDVASAIGCNKYKSPQEIFEKYSCDDKEQYENKYFYLDTNATQKIVKEFGTAEDYIEIEKLQQFKAREPTKEAIVVKRSIETALKQAIDSKTVVESNEKEQEVILKLTNVTNKIDSKHLTGIVNKERGINEEEGILNRHEILHKKSVNYRNNQLYYVEFKNVLVGGRVDGLREDNQLVEVKNRRNRFLGFPKYEQVQCELYLRMTNCKTGTHIEQFDGHVNETVFTQDDELFKAIKDGLEHFYKTWYS